MKYLSLLILLQFASCQGQHTTSQMTGEHGDHAYTNALAKETSPYLLQHAHNPVDWHPWGEAALAKAKAEDKLLLISIGYAACHWCHVMEHESFEDTLVAQIMNDNFVCIKVDREERPDVDDVYMTACQLASGGGGWPLNSVAMPDGRPIWAGTYFPKKEWLNVLNNFIQLKKDKPDQLEEYAANLTEGISVQDQIPNFLGDPILKAEDLKPINGQFLTTLDYEKGGRSGAPKFPLPNQFEYLLDQYHYIQDPMILKGVESALDNMDMGGIQDQLAGGFARYSTDAKWLVPHFEKMLYDNGQLVSLYAHGYQVTKKPEYKQVVENTLGFIERELTDESGGFYSSLDADSEGEEGKFYIFTKAEIDKLLGADAELFNKYYNVTDKGNWEHGNNILHRQQDDATFLKRNNATAEQLAATLKIGKEKLFEHRSKRIRPGLDDKVLASWNALMLKGYIDAYRAFGNEEYLVIAKKNAAFLEKWMLRKNGQLYRNYKNKKATINAFLDDYALTIEAFIAMYQVTFDEHWLSLADKMAIHVEDHFKDANSVFYFYTSDLDPPLVARKKELNDNVIPGSNSSMARSLFQLGTLMYKPEYVEKANLMVATIAEQVKTTDRPGYFSNWLRLWSEITHSPYEVAILGDDYENKRLEFQKHFLPQVMFLGGKDEGKMALLKDKLQDGRTMIYVCQNKACKLPVEEVPAAMLQMK